LGEYTMALDDELKADPALSEQAPPDEPTFWRVRATPDDLAEAEPPPESPDWRQRYEQVFEGGLSVEWKIRERKFWLVHQIESGSEDFVDAGSVFGVYPGAGDEQVLKSLRVSAEVTRERLQLEPDIKFKAIEMDPCAPETQPPWWSRGDKGPIPAAERRAAAKGTQPWYWSFEGPIRAANEDASTVVELAKRIGSGPVERADDSSADKAVGDDDAFAAAVRCFYGDESSADKAVRDDCEAGEVSEEETGDEHPEITRDGEEPSMFRESLFRGIAKTLCPFCNGAVLYDPGGTMKAPLGGVKCFV
jgi:hypothetical protein